jgi:four helix bundle suffix protein
MTNESLIPQHGGYRKLKSFCVAQLVYDLTVRFCDRYVNPRSRTHDQMVQAARSGVQNIAEGSAVSATSKKMEIKLTQVARASLEELRLDYEDFLRQRNLRLWHPYDRRRQDLVDRRCATVEDVAAWIGEMHQSGCSRQSGPGGRPLATTPSTESTSSTPLPSCPPPTYPEIAANAALVLINVACALLNRQIEALGAAFTREGGFTERLYRIRSERRRRI